MAKKCEKRKKYIQVYLTEEEYREVVDKCVLSGRSGAALFREAVKHTRTWTAVDQEAYKARTFTLVRASDSLETLAKQARLIPGATDQQTLALAIEKSNILLEKLWKDRTPC